MNYTFPRFSIYGSGWTTTYEPSGTLVVSRPKGSDTATVSAKMKVYTPTGDVSTWKMHVTINGTDYTTSNSSFHSGGGTYSMTFSKNLSVGVDEGTITCKMWLEIVGFSTISQKWTATLEYGSKGCPAISLDRSSVNVGGTFNVSFTPDRADYTFRIKLKCGTWSTQTDVITVSDTSKHTELMTLSDYGICNQIRTSRTGTLTVELTAYDSSNQNLGSTSATLKVKVPNNSTTRPTVTITSVSNVAEEGDTGILFDHYAAGISCLSVVASVTCKYSATAVSGVCTYGSVSSDLTMGDTLTVITPRLTETGAIEVTATVKDSRGLSGTSEPVTINVYEYFKPSITSADCDVISDTEIDVTVKGRFAMVNDENQYKHISITRTNLSNNATQTYTDNVVPDANGYYNYVLTDGDVTAATTSSFKYDVTVTDARNSANKSCRTAAIALSFLAGGHGASMFREAVPADSKKFSVDGGIYADGAIRSNYDASASTHSAYTQAMTKYECYNGDGTKTFEAGPDGIKLAGGLFKQSSVSVSLTIPATGTYYKAGEVNLTPTTGYQIIGFCAYAMSGNAQMLNVYRMGVLGNKAYYSIANTGSSQQSTTLKIYYLEAKISAL